MESRPANEGARLGAWDKAILLWVELGIVDPGEVVEELLAEAAPLARERGQHDFAAWCDRWLEPVRRGPAADTDPEALATVERIVAESRPVGAPRISSTALTRRLLDVLRSDDDGDAGGWGLHGAAHAAAAYVLAGGSSGLSAAERAQHAGRAWLLGCLALTLIRQSRTCAP